MTTRVELPHLTSILVRLLAPTDAKTGGSIDNTTTSGVATLKIYDADKNGVLLQDYTTGAEVLRTSVLPTVAGVGDMVEISQNNADPYLTTIVGLSVTSGTITLNSGIPLNADEGNRAIVRLGAAINMDEFGTPQSGKTDWGFQAVVPANHEGLTPGLDVNLEMNLVGDPTSDNLTVLETVCGRIADDCND
jgi:hypothetical protein